MICAIPTGVRDTYLCVLSLERATPNIPIAAEAMTLTVITGGYVLVVALSVSRGKGSVVLPPSIRSLWTPHDQLDPQLQVVTGTDSG